MPQQLGVIDDIETGPAPGVDGSVLVPLGFENYPALASRVQRWASDLWDGAFLVPDHLQQELDIDVLNMAEDLRRLAARLQVEVTNGGVR